MKQCGFSSARPALHVASRWRPGDALPEGHTVCARFALERHAGVAALKGLFVEVRREGKRAA